MIELAPIYTPAEVEAHRAQDKALRRLAAKSKSFRRSLRAAHRQSLKGQKGEPIRSLKRHMKREVQARVEAHTGETYPTWKAARKKLRKLTRIPAPEATA